MLGTDCPIFEAMSLSYATQPIMSNEPTVIYDSGFINYLLLWDMPWKCCVQEENFNILLCVYTVLDLQN